MHTCITMAMADCFLFYKLYLFANIMWIYGVLTSELDVERNHAAEQQYDYTLAASVKVYLQWWSRSISIKLSIIRTGKVHPMGTVQGYFLFILGGLCSKISGGCFSIVKGYAQVKHFTIILLLLHRCICVFFVQNILCGVQITRNNFFLHYTLISAM